MCNIIMAITIYKTLKIIYDKNVENYKEFLNIIFDGKIYLSNIINNIINVFLCVTFFIMISGFGAYLAQSFNFNKILGSGILAILSFFVLKNKNGGFAKINEIIIPILILFVLIIGIKNIEFISENKSNILINKSAFWILQAILYASYNLILTEPVLISLKKYIQSQKQILFISIGVCIIMILLAGIEFLLLMNVDVDFKSLDMPLVYVVENKFPKLKLIYGAIILIAIFTTAISVGNSFLSNVYQKSKNYPQIVLILCITSVIISPIGFSKLVERLFPLFGFLGIVQVFKIVMFSSKKSKKVNYLL